MQTYRGTARYHRDLTSKRSRRVITSAQKNQDALDNGPIYGHSLFTGTLIQGIKTGEADTNRDGLLTSSELGLFIQQRVSISSGSIQTPDFGSFKFDDRGEMVIVIDKLNQSYLGSSLVSHSSNKVIHPSQPALKLSSQAKPLNIDYTRLQNALKTEDWKQADCETYLVLIQAARTEKMRSKKAGWLSKEEIEQMPCDVLQGIDQLWIKHSRKLFGFSVQKQLWLDVGDQIDTFDSEVFREFGDRVGWRKSGSWLWKYDSLTFSLGAESGHLPSLAYNDSEIIWSNNWRESFRSFLPRICACI